LQEPFFEAQEKLLPKGPLGGRRFSVSRLVIGLSDYTVLVWVMLVANSVYALEPRLLGQQVNLVRAVEAWVGFTLIYVAYLAVAGRSGKPPQIVSQEPSPKPEASSGSAQTVLAVKRSEERAW
jgi:hypothetical protein